MLVSLYNLYCKPQETTYISDLREKIIFSQGNKEFQRNGQSISQDQIRNQDNGVKRTFQFPNQLVNCHLTVCATVSPRARAPPPAIADQPRSKHLNAKQIRRQACEYIFKHKQFYECGFTEDENIEQYISSMRDDGNFEDERMFAAIYAKFSVRFRIKMIGEVVFDEGDASAPIVELGYFGHVHYISICREWFY
ncbi:MAG: hypothetical protein EZS28_020072 [Streblomastix strix]|uniref:OTU domain-containing protein n=1 Tax=Streblomastix strix TaxID=222440 RepID=A0A5J4VP86_9EUKA|nr:MAG: hypothetical protein EZS28_020072 [Streblomastix strix]